jgi:tetratricopeptide (TPR) repeat protein
MNPDDMCSELIDLAEASLALGDAEAALQLLDQVEDSCRDNRWIVTYSETLRLRGDYEECLALVNDNFMTMIESAEWTFARSLLLDATRTYDHQSNDLECLEFLCSLAFGVKSHTNVDPHFYLQLVSIAASRISGLGDPASASAMLAMAEGLVDTVQDARAMASYLWVKSEIAEMSADIDLAISLMTRVFTQYAELEDWSAVVRIVIRLSFLASVYLDVNPDLLFQTKRLVADVMTRQLGDSSSSDALWLQLNSVHLDLVSGDTQGAIACLEWVVSAYSLDYQAIGYAELLYAKCEIQSGNVTDAHEHLQLAHQIYLAVHGTEWGNQILRVIAHTYMELGEDTVAQDILVMSSPPQSDLSWCLKNFTL